LITHSTTGCCVLQSPQELTTSFHWLSFPLALLAQNLRLAPTVLHSNSTGGQLLRLGSVFRHPARQVAETSDLRRLFRASHRPSADLPAFAGVPPQARLATNFRLTPGADPSARLVSSFRLSPAAVATCQLAPTSAAASSLRLLPPVCHTSGELPTRIGCSPPASPVSIRSACALRFYLRLGL